MTVKKSKKTTSKKVKTGRAEKKINWKMIDDLCMIQCTLYEIEAIVGITDDTLRKHCMRDHGMTLLEYMRSKRALGVASVRRELFKKAMSGETRSLIYLSEKYLRETKEEKEKRYELIYPSDYDEDEKEDENVIKVEFVSQIIDVEFKKANEND